MPFRRSTEAEFLLAKNLPSSKMRTWRVHEKINPALFIDEIAWTLKNEEAIP